jgi:hypothetical protein
MAFSIYKGGRLPPHPEETHPRLYLDDFLRGVSPVIEDVDWCSEVENDLPMDRNDELGDCGIAGMDHWQIAASHYAGNPSASWGDSLCTSLYSVLGHYVEGDPGTDNGTVLQDNLSYWRNTGVSLPGGGTDKILFYGALRSWDRTTRVRAMKALGPLYLGIRCPESAEQQFSEGQPWTVVKGSPDAGGHCTVQLAEFHTADEIREATWGSVARANRAFMMATTEEVWAIGSADFVERNGSNPSGLDVEGMNEALASLTGQSNPLGLRKIL